MITIKLQIILVFASVFSFFFIVNMIRKYNLELRYSLLWMFFCLVNLILAIFSKISFVVASALGIKEPVNAIFLLSFIFQFFLIFSMTLTISRYSSKFTKLVQEVGILRKEVEDQKKVLASLQKLRENE